MGWSPPVDTDRTRGVASLALLCELADELGRPSRALLDAAGVTESALAQPSTTLTAQQELAAIGALIVDPAEASELGVLAGTRYQLTTYGIWAYALLSSPTLRDVVDVALSHVGLSFACTTVTGKEADGEFQLCFADWPIPEHLRQFVLARDLVAALGILRAIFDSTMTPDRIELALPRPAHPASFTRALGRPPRFDAQESALVFDSAILDEPLPQASELTAQMCVAQCRELLDARVARRGLSGQVRDRLLGDPRRLPGQEEVAADLHMSVRSMRRRLTQEGTTFRELLEQTRRGLAEELLLSHGMNVDQVAARVGYSDTSAFVHAFRRWNHEAPGRWLRRQEPTASRS